MFDVPASLPLDIGVRGIDNLREFGGRKVIGWLLRYLHQFHFLRRVSEQPIVLHTEIEKTIQAVVFPLRGQRSVIPPGAEFP